MSIIYNGTDITNESPYVKCEHDMYLMDRADTLMVAFDNTSGRWTKWAPKKGDTIRITEGAADTGLMYAAEISVDGVEVRITASAVRESRKAVRTWKMISLLQLAGIIADEYGLKAETYGITDRKYPILRQDGEEGLSFLNMVLAVNGAACLTYDGKLIAYSLEYLDSLPPSGSALQADDRNIRIEDGDYLQNIPAGSPYIAVNQKEGYLKRLNWDRKRGYVYSDSILPGIYAGTKITLLSTYWSSALTTVTHVRHDYGRGISKIWFRKAG